MENQTKINWAMLVIMLTGFTTIVVTDDKGMELESTHYCESKGVATYCFDVRDYGLQKDYRCLWNENNLRRFNSCPSGWKEIPKDIPEGQNINSKRIHCIYPGCE